MTAFVVGPASDDLRAVAARGVPAGLDWARTHAGAVPHPGSGSTLARWEWLATVAATDLTLARVVEPHLDALSILHEAARLDGRPVAGVDPDATWGVYAAEGPGVRLSGSPTSPPTSTGWALSGTKPWCSLAGEVSHGLMTAWTGDGTTRGLFAVDLRQDGVEVETGAWCPAGLADVVTATVHLDDVAAVPVGGPGWYVGRPGFAWGGIGVAAVWFGGAVGLVRRMVRQAQVREPDQVGLLHLGAVDAALAAAASVLATAAAQVDATAEPAPGEAALLAARVRHVVADVAEQVLHRAGHALGPGPLAHEPEHVRRVADLTLYVRQHHAERDSAALGRLLLEGESW